MSVTRRQLIAGLVLLACGTGLGTAQPAPEAAAHTVTIEGMVFTPAALTIKPGDSVTWINRDVVEHTATSTGATKPGFDSGMIAPDKSWTRVFQTAGAFDYVCTYHPPMRGSVEVR